MFKSHALASFPGSINETIFFLSYVSNLVMLEKVLTLTFFVILRLFVIFPDKADCLSGLRRLKESLSVLQVNIKIF